MARRDDRKGYVQIDESGRIYVVGAHLRRTLGQLSGYYTPLNTYLAEHTGKTTPEEEKRHIPPTAATRKAFSDLKAALLSAPVLAYPRFDKDAPPFILDTD